MNKRSVSGMRWKGGALPRAAATLGLEPIHLDADRVRSSLRLRREDFTNPTGNVPDSVSRVRLTSCRRASGVACVTASSMIGLRGNDLRAFAGFSCIEPGQRQELVSQARKAFPLGETRAQGLLIFDTRPGSPKPNFQLRAEARQGRAKLV